MEHILVSSIMNHAHLYKLHHYSIQGKTAWTLHAFLIDKTQREGEPYSEVIAEELNRPNEVGNSE